MTLLACPRCGDLSDPGSTRCETCNAPLLVVSAVSLYPDAPPPQAAVHAVGAGEAAQTRQGVAGTTAVDRMEGAEAGVAPGERQDARPGDPAKVGDARLPSCRSGDTGATPQANGRLSAPLSPAVPLGMESPRSSELQAAIMRAHKGWAETFAPHLLEEWLH